MQVQSRQGATGNVAAASAASVAHVHRRMGAPLIAVAIAGAVLAIASGATSVREIAPVEARPTARVASDMDGAGSTRLDVAVGWIDGLASGLVLPSDVTTRLALQRPRVAEAVTAAWSLLRRSGDRTARRETVGWIDGLASGLVLPSDVTTRLATQEPRMARNVIASILAARHRSSNRLTGETSTANRG